MGNGKKGIKRKEWGGMPGDYEQLRPIHPDKGTYVTFSSLPLEKNNRESE